MSVGSLHEAAEILTLRPEIDLLLLDLLMPGVQDIDGIIEVARQYASKRVVLMSGRVNSVDVLRAIRGGLRGFIPKTHSGSGLVSALRLIDCGKTYFPATSFLRRNQVEPILSDREYEIILELRRGGTNREIAKHLDLDEMTVMSTLRSAGAKLEARGRTEIAMKSLDHPEVSARCDNASGALTYFPLR